MDTSQSAPLSIVAIFGVVWGVRLAWSAFRTKGWKRNSFIMACLAILPVSVFFLLALNPWLVDARFRAFRAFYYDLEEGMTRAEVFAELERHYPESGKRGRPTLNVNKDDQVMFFMNTEDGSHTCEGVFINLHEGKVTGVSYSCD
ncbi:MAG: hypothetical protein ACON5H_10930 [Akkermansiaceae bacterium]